MKFSDTIYVLRKRLKLSQSQFGDLIGVSNKTISKWENNSTLPDIEMLANISTKCGISTDELLGLSGAVEKEGSLVVDESDNLKYLKFVPIDNDTAYEVRRLTVDELGEEKFSSERSRNAPVKSSYIRGSVNIPESYKNLPITSIADKTFYMCSDLISIIIPPSVKNIGVQAFASCSALENIIIPHGVKEIQASAFLYCRKLTSIIIPDSVSYIGVNAFGYCTELKNVTLPKDVIVDKGAFIGCSVHLSIEQQRK